MTAPHSGSTLQGTEGTPIQVASLVFGVVFLVVGIAGFIPGLTTDYDRLGTSGTWPPRSSDCSG